MNRQKMDSLSFELLSRMAHMMTRMTHWLDSNDSLARWLAVCKHPGGIWLKRCWVSCKCQHFKEITRNCS